ncbi:ABC transporter permease [Acanthopleuribacter pedis]|uniref:ABC transporter permease n=1 Tax=Acanthopleuribacter pedis TaxID=442870 RepID=A0A8J7U4V5_9BACT|nr:ABC transporter permease [Acanthopleuribacter pedis]MBO1321047.1 ABC transporter permease [Acanthopleuribacter pedis]
MNEWRLDFEEALEKLATQKLRTFLTLLGMVFGVGAVIAMQSIGEGAEREALSLIEAMGTRNVIAKNRPFDPDQLREIREQSRGLNLDDMEAARATLSFVSETIAVKKVQAQTIFSAAGKSDAMVVGQTSAGQTLAMRLGRPLLPHDDVTVAKVCVIGSQTAFDLFGNRDPLGERLRINHLWLTVVGVVEDRILDKEEFQGVAIENPRNRIYVPLSTALNHFKSQPLDAELDEIHFSIERGYATAAAGRALARLLHTRHREADDFDLVVPEQLLQQHRRTQDIFNIVMAAIAGISLLVGGIGIMNIMLANVLERTREIGLRRALGARRGDIRRLFMIEAFLIAGLGGFLGLVIGFAIAEGISLYSGWSVAWSPGVVLPAIAVCAAVGLIFGIYPAVKAAQLDPIQALRHD